MINPIGRVLRLSFLTTLLAATLCAQKTLYVDNVAGSDTGSGLSAHQPKRSLSSVIGLSEPGDTISVAATAQTYDEIATVRNKALVFRSNGGAPALRRLVVDNSPPSRVWFNGPFFIDSLDLTTGIVEGSNHLTISADGSVIRRSPDALVAEQLNYAGPVNVEYTGSSGMTTALEFPSADTIGLKNLVLNFEVTSATPSLSLTRTIRPDNIDFRHGLLFSQQHEVVLRSPVGSPEQGFTRSIKTGGTSHVVGFVRRTLKSGSIIAFGRNEYPVGDSLTYRPLAYQIVNYSSESKSLGHDVLATYENQRPTGIVGLPIRDGVTLDVDIARYPDFFWRVVADTALVSVQCNLETTATGYNDFSDVADIRTIYRSGGSADTLNPWNLFGVQYDNYVISGTPTIVCNNAVGITRGAEMIVTFGLQSRMVIAHPIQNVSLSYYNHFFMRNLLNPPLFTGNIGRLKFSVAVANPAIVSASITEGDTLIITHRVSGATTVTVTATDIDGSRVSFTFAVFPEGDCGPPYQPVPSYSMSHINFGSRPIGTTRDTVFTVRELGCTGFQILNMFFTDSSFSAEKKSGYVGPPFKDTLRFTPTKLGLTTGHLLIYTNTKSLPDTIDLAGFGDPVVSVDENPIAPTRFVLSQNYPNPFNPSTTIEFALPSEQFVRLSIFDVLGHEVAGLMEERLLPGFHKTEWNAANQPSGIYFYRLQAGTFIETKKLILVR